MSHIEYKVTVYSNGDIYWHNKEGLFHREDGPAVEYPNGSKHWYINNELHREDGPAVEFANGNRYWYIKGKRHREDGPAKEYANGTKRWYLEDVEYTEEEYNKKMNPVSCNNKEVEIDGKTYILKEKS